jgi:hypothetical protein
MAEFEKNVYPDKEITVLKITGEVTCDQIIDELTLIYEEEVTRNFIWDFSIARGKSLTGNDLQQIVTHTKEYGHLRKNGKTAFVISTSLGFGLGRMYDSLAQVADHPVKHGVFRSYDEAVAWIESTDADLF